MSGVNMRQCARAAILVVLCLAGSSCSTTSAREDAFARFLASSDTNQSVTLEPLDSEASRAEGTYVAVQVRNSSNSYATFPPGYGPRGFLWNPDNREWSELPNEVVFPDVDFELGPSGGEVPYIGVADFASRDTRLLGSAGVRILVQGYLIDSEGTPGEAVSGFLDVALP